MRGRKPYRWGFQMSGQHVAVVVVGLCLTLVAGTLAEVSQHLSRADPPAYEPSDATPRDMSSIDAECSMRLHVTQARLAESCNTLASRPDLRQLTLSYDRRTDFPVPLLRVMRQLPRLEVVMFQTQAAFSVEAISQFPSLRVLFIHQTSTIAPGSFPHLANLASLHEVRLPAKYAHAFLAQVGRLPDLTLIRFEGECPQQPVNRATQRAIRGLDGKLKVFETTEYATMHPSVLRALASVRSLEVLGVDVGRGFRLSDAVALSRLKNLRAFAVGFSPAGISEADERTARTILHGITLSARARSRAEPESRMKKRAASQAVDLQLPPVK